MNLLRGQDFLSRANSRTGVVQIIQIIGVLSSIISLGALRVPRFGCRPISIGVCSVRFASSLSRRVPIRWRARKMKPGLDLAGRRQGYDVHPGAEGLEWRRAGIA